MMGETNKAVPLQVVLLEPRPRTGGTVVRAPLIQHEIETEDCVTIEMSFDRFHGECVADAGSLSNSLRWLVAWAQTFALLLDAIGGLFGPEAAGRVILQATTLYSIDSSRI